MAAVIETHQPELVGQGALILLGPDEVALTEAMDQQNGFAVGLAVFMHDELQATATGYRVYGHVSSSTALGCLVSTSNAPVQRRRSRAVGCNRLILIEAPSPAY